ncbi:MAG: selenocysteine-specific translation elongation factor [Chloroflexia bacterium]
MYVIGTAGHVDHGKSTLVKALTGIDPDRLREEKEREMTIDLGFAWLKLPGGEEVSVVDVPGHERFIKNMLAGVGGIDAALLVIAADEGPMPQTDEHLNILHLLGVDRGLVVLTKRELVDDEWLGLVQEEVRDRLAGTTLAGARIVPVSARTGEGLDDLKAAISDLLAGTTQRPDKGRPRLPIDRVFSVAGFGTVVTGTLNEGSLHLGQEVEIVPGGLRSRVRGLQSHKHKTETAPPGGRVAVNLGGVAVDDLRRGQVLTAPGWLEPTVRIDARLHLLADAPGPLAQNALLDFFAGASESSCRVTLLDAQRLEPGSSGWVTLRLSEPVPVVKGDRFILRRPSPSLTIGGGEVIAAHPRRHRRFDPASLRALETLERGTPEELLLQALGGEAREVRAALDAVGLPADAARAALASALASGDAVRLSRGDEPTGELPPAALIMGLGAWNALAAKMREAVGRYHTQHPLRRGLGKEELKSRLGLTPKVYSAAVARAVAGGLLAEDATTFRLPEHEVRFEGPLASQVAGLKSAFAASPYSPPAPADLGLDPELVAALLDRGDLVKVASDIYYDRATYDLMTARILDAIDTHGSIAVADLRDMFGTTRKYAVPFMEHLDEVRLTRRQGDVRVRR